MADLERHTARSFLIGLLVLGGFGPPANRGAAAEGPEKSYDEGSLKVTHVGPVASDILGVTFRAGKIVYGKQVPYEAQETDTIGRSGHQRFVSRSGKLLGSLVGKDAKLVYTPDRYVGDRIDTPWVRTAASYRLESLGGPSDARPVPLSVLGHKTRPTDLGRVGPLHAWQFASPTETTVYLKLSTPLVVGNRYRLGFQGKPLPPAEFAFDPVHVRSEAVHVSHVGFHPGDPAKVAFLSLWAGSGGPLDYEEGRRFQVVDPRDGRVAFEGASRLSKSKNDATEDAYRKNYNGTDVYILDFSQLREVGTYVVAVSDLGCSYPFRVHPGAWRDAFRTSARGFYHQRSGIKLGAPYTAFERPRPFHPDDGVRVYASTCSLMDSGNGLNYLGTDKDNFGNLVRGKTDEIVADAWGGTMDAGDWDRRIQHLLASRYLLELAELFPATFDQLSLNIPESGDGLPDVVSEALFNLDCYRRMQTADGGIRGGIESAEHPRHGEGSWQESLDVLAYAPGVWSSHWYAGVAARAAGTLRNRNPDLARTYEASALGAMEYAERAWRELGEPEKKDGGVVDERNLAAAELYRLTGDEQWNRVFLETSVFHDPAADLFKWPEHNQRDAAWVYVRSTHSGVDTEVQNNCRSAILREAESRVRQCYRAGFRWTKFEWAPPAFGAFTVSDTVSMIRAHVLTRDARYLRATILACQHGAGANPINMCYTTGIGPNAPLHPLHIDSRVTDQLPPPGLTVFGPMAYEQGKDQWGQALVDPVLFPTFDKWPAAEAYWDVFWYPPMCEFTIHVPMATNAYTWGYLAAVTRDAPAGK